MTQTTPSLLVAIALLAVAACARPAADRFDPADPPPLADSALDFELGVALETGQGVAVDLEAAALRYRRACDAAHARACNNLGVMRDEGRGGASDPAQAAALFARACDASPPAPDGCFNLALAALDGRGVDADPGRARALFARACDGGEASACHNLGLALERANDPEAARAAFDRACRADVAPACERLAPPTE